MKTKIWLAMVTVVVVVTGAVGLVLYLQESPSPASLSEAPKSQAQGLKWEELLAKIESMDGAEIREHGLRYFQAGDPDKAFLMFKTAAKRGDGWSALAVGEMYDPATFSAADFSPTRTAFNKPNPRKALQWYDQAIANGEDRAEPLYDRLLVYLQDAAAGGDAKAQRLLDKVKK
ncbi:MAG: hypothetical protein OEQ39_11980 [Gammaproteobacteria bacterium]|nr:hypothetical protein [Gammaproteobacteria bacterium]MDH3466603.1 hypothetical protein [Gammaproteobacteria bacterium]